MKSQASHIPLVEPEATAHKILVAAVELDLLLKELAEHKDIGQRLAADFEKFKDRCRQESDARAAGQKIAFICDLLPVMDNLERALAGGASPGAHPLHQGVKMTLQQLRQLLRQHGIESDECVGQPFDPRHHEAVSQRHDPARADQVILEVYQRGYRCGEKLLRPARVAVNSLAPIPQP